jgi:hypothetical protein
MLTSHENVKNSGQIFRHYYDNMVKMTECFRRRLAISAVNHDGESDKNGKIGEKNVQHFRIGEKRTMKKRHTPNPNFELR